METRKGAAAANKPANDAAALEQLRAIQAQLPRGTTLADLAAKAQAAQAALQGIEGYMAWLRPGGNFHAQHEPAAHHRVIIEALEKVERGEIDKLMILAPPGSAKSTYVSRLFATWYLLRHPERLLICASNTEALAVETLNRDRRSIVADPLWAELGAVTGATLDEKAAALAYFRTTNGGGILAAGVGSSITGQRATAGLLLDDPVIDIEHASSATRLSKDFDWFEQVFRQRGVPGSFEIVVSTRWSAQDICGRLLERHERGEEHWHVIRLPMLADSPDDPLGRQRGEPLWPEWYTDSMLASARRNPMLWLSQYQQHPPNEAGTWLGGRDVLLYTDPEQRPEHLARFLAADIALSEVSRSDFTVLAEVGIDQNRNLHILNLRRFRATADRVAEAALEMYTDGTLELVIDDDNASKLFRHLLVERARRLGRPIPSIHLMPMRGRSKEDRASALRAMFNQRMVRIMRADWNADLEFELLSFPSASSSDHDDQVDALSLAARRAVVHAPAPPEPIIPHELFGFVVPDEYGQPSHYRETIEELFETHARYTSGRGRIA